MLSPSSVTAWVAPEDGSTTPTLAPRVTNQMRPDQSGSRAIRQSSSGTHLMVTFLMSVICGPMMWISRLVVATTARSSWSK